MVEPCRVSNDLRRESEVKHGEAETLDESDPGGNMDRLVTV